MIVNPNPEVARRPQKWLVTASRVAEKGVYSAYDERGWSSVPILNYKETTDLKGAQATCT